MDYKAVIFDFDYTLGDATDAIFAGFRHGFSVMGYPEPDRETVRHTVGMLLEDAYTQLTGDATEQGRAAFRAQFSSVARPMQAAGTPLCEGAEALLHALRAAGVATAVVSTKHTETLESIFAQHGLLDVFSFVIGGDKVRRPKPDPEGLLASLTALGLEPHEVLFCGDTVIDGEAARRAGTHFCAVLNGTTTFEEFQTRRIPCDHVAGDLWDLKQWLGLN